MAHGRSPRTPGPPGRSSTTATTSPISDYIVPGMPTSYFIDREGIVRAFSLGGFSRDGLAAQLETILPEA